MNRNTFHVVYAVTGLAVVGIAGLVGLEAFADGNSEPLMVVLVGFLATTITALLNIGKTDEANQKLDKLDGRLNGELDSRIEAAVDRALSRWTAPPS